MRLGGGGLGSGTVATVDARRRPSAAVGRAQASAAGCRLTARQGGLAAAFEHTAITWPRHTRARPKNAIPDAVNFLKNFESSDHLTANQTVDIF